MLNEKTLGSHQTINRVTRILEEVVYRPGSTYAEITRAIGAPKSSVYGFIRGLISVDWLFERDHRLYLGPALFSLAIASGHIRAGLVTPADLDSLHRATGLTVFVGIRAGDHLIYISEAGSDLMAGFEARTNIRRNLLDTAGGKAMLATLPEAELESYLRSRPPEQRDQVYAFVQEVGAIRESQIAVNVNDARARTGMATVLRDISGRVVASVTLVGTSPLVLPRLDLLSELLITHVSDWRNRSVTPREAI
jgi:DNA-binding IclR family transcriptional regulator